MRALDALSGAISWVTPHQCPQWSARLPAAGRSMGDGMATLLVNGTSVISGNSADIAGGGAYNFGMFTLGSQSVITNQHGRCSLSGVEVSEVSPTKPPRGRYGLVTIALRSVHDCYCLTFDAGTIDHGRVKPAPTSGASVRGRSSYAAPSAGGGSQPPTGAQTQRGRYG